MERKRKIALIVLSLMLVIALAVAGIAFYAQSKEAHHNCSYCYPLFLHDSLHASLILVLQLVV